jgi:uncharacterized protein YcaQ
VSSIAIDRQTARRFRLGRLGLWPGRRWAGRAGAAEAIRALGGVQIDPLNVVGRNHDLTLFSRVVEYDPAHLDALLYQERAFFDYGGLLFIYPVEERPYWTLHMRRRAEQRAEFAADHAELIDEVRRALRERGPLGHRDFAGGARVESYRARKDTGLALWHLWITGELATHSRRRFERLYGFADELLPQNGASPSDEEAEHFFAQKVLNQIALGTPTHWGRAFYHMVARPYDRAEARTLFNALLDAGEATAVTIEGDRTTWHIASADLSLLETIAGGEVPECWQPLGSSTEDEVVLLAPLDPAIHDRSRARARAIFDFEYLWEVYVPAPRRRWGYYTLPVLYGDRLVARLDPKLDRAGRTLSVAGFWLEDDGIAGDPHFAAALGRGLARLARFAGGSKVAAEGIQPARLRRAVTAEAKAALKAG